MQKNLKLGHINLKDESAFTLLEVILSVVIMAFFVITSLGFVNNLVGFFNHEQSDLFKSVQEKTALMYLFKDLLQSREIQIEKDTIRFEGIYKNELSSIVYTLYKSNNIHTLGKKTKSRLMPVINDIESLSFSRKNDLILIDFLMSNRKKDKIKIIVKSRKENGGNNNLQQY